MHIIFDMDNTLSDEFGQKVRPGIVELLEKLSNDGHRLSLWTSSTKERAIQILNHLNLRKHFTKFIFREDYDPEGKDLKKDIREIDGDWLIDDDPAQIEFIREIGLPGFRITPFRTGGNPETDELDNLYKEISKLTKRSFWNRV